MRLTTHASSLTTTLIASCLLVGCAEQPAEPQERTAPTGTSEVDAFVQIAHANCVAGGATAADAALASQVRSQMNGRRLGRLVDGYNVSCARSIVDTTRGRGLSSRAAVIAVTTAITESTLHNYTQAVDHDSLGLFQQRPSQGWGTPAQITNPTYATNAFVNAMLRKFPGNSWMTGDIGAICQRVQVSAFPDAYRHEVHDAQLLVDALWRGESGDAVTGIAPDFDGDGKGDIVGTWADGTMTAYLNIGTPGHPSFGSQRNIGAGWNNITKIAVVDADNDSKLDLLGVWSDGTLTAYLNLSTPRTISFGNQQNIGTGWNNITRIAVIDADNDGKDDLIGTWTNGTMTAYLNTGTPGRPAFGNQQNIGTGWNNITKIVVVDSDRDGKDDLVGTWTNGTMTAYLNTGTPGRPSFGNQQNIGAGWTGITKIVVVDADRDGKNDLIGTWTNGTMTAYLSIGTPGHPGFGNQQSIGAGWDGITRIVVADADGDGKDDLVGTWANGTMTAYLNTGTPGRPGFGNQQNIGTGWNGITKIATVH